MPSPTLVQLAATSLVKEVKRRSGERPEDSDERSRFEYIRFDKKRAGARFYTNTLKGVDRGGGLVRDDAPCPN